MKMLLFTVTAVAAGAVQGLLFPPGPWGFGDEGYRIAYFLNWDLNLLLTLLFFFLIVHRRPKEAPASSTARTVIRVLAFSSTILLVVFLLLFLDSRVVAGLITIQWVLLWFYLYTVIEYLKRLVKTFERDQFAKILVLFVVLTFNSFAFHVALGVHGGSITGYWLVLAFEFGFTFLLLTIAGPLLGWRDVPGH